MLPLWTCNTIMPMPVAIRCWNGIHSYFSLTGWFIKTMGLIFIWFDHIWEDGLIDIYRVLYFQNWKVIFDYLCMLLYFETFWFGRGTIIFILSFTYFEHWSWSTVVYFTCSVSLKWNTGILRIAFVI